MSERYDPMNWHRTLDHQPTITELRGILLQAVTDGAPATATVEMKGAQFDGNRWAVIVRWAMQT